MPTIRPCQTKDQANMQKVCIATGPEEARRKDGPRRLMLLTTYCDYYVEREPQNCFVIADDNDEAVGYILCAQDYWKYFERFMKDYVPRSKKLPLPQRVECRGAAWIPRLFVKKYPAHLHIDILPEYQRMGLGTQLMDTLTAHLRAKGIPGVMLGVAADNEKGRNFYKKYGFKQLLRIPMSVVMGLEL
ncbi:MAG: GNAT family N-acetyltransferase [Oscillospiraceae bacterium]|nr:GNAT family N-acetyltransferase [Oscillospiraceae bacterium]